MKQQCHACGIEKDPDALELYPFPEDGVVDDQPISPFFTLDCQPTSAARERSDWRVARVCHACFHRLDVDQWISDACWESLNPVTPFEQLPKLPESAWFQLRLPSPCATQIPGMLTAAGFHVTAQEFRFGIAFSCARGSATVQISGVMLPDDPACCCLTATSSAEQAVTLKAVRDLLTQHGAPASVTAERYPEPRV
ncbi:MAG: hypothetical protein V4662_20495 [Verrucomicrobiota bacterium]